MRRPSPALVVACIALFFSLAGTGYAVSQLPRNSVGAAQLKKNAVTAVKIKNNAVTGAKVKDRSLTSKDFAAGTLLKGDTGAQGPVGPSGPSASAWSFGSVEGGATLPVGPTNRVLVALGSSASGDGTFQRTGTLRVSRPSRLSINGSVSLDIADAAASDTRTGFVNCFAQVGDAAAGTWEVPSYAVDAYASTPDLAPSTTITIPIVAFADVAAGTYDVRIACYRSNEVIAVALAAGFTVIATDQ